MPPDSRMGAYRPSDTARQGANLTFNDTKTIGYIEGSMIPQSIRFHLGPNLPAGGILPQLRRAGRVHAGRLRGDGDRWHRQIKAQADADHRLCGSLALAQKGHVQLARLDP